MPRLSDAQFQDYQFRAQKSEHGGVNVVVAHMDPEGEATPLGSMQISTQRGKDQNWLQERINLGVTHPNTGKPFTHGQKEEPSGQQRWTEGNMQPRPQRVSWLGMSEEAPKTLLRGMMGLAVGIHGRVPVADYELSQHGSEIARGAARKYGVPAHPENPTMEPRFRYGTEDEPTEHGSAEEEVKGGAEQSWAMSETKSIGVNAPAHWEKPTNMAEAEKEGQFNASRYQIFTAAQVHDITQDVEKNILQKRLRVDPRVPVHPSQGKLF